MKQMRLSVFRLFSRFAHAKGRAIYGMLCLAPAAVLMVVLLTPPAFAADRGVSLSGDETPYRQNWGTYHTLVIGIDRYQIWPQLRTAVRDAVEVSRVLQERYGFAPEHVILRTDQDANRIQLISDIRSLASSLGPDDNLLVYFAGHGQLDDLTGNGYWIPVEGEPNNPATWVSNSFIKDVFSSSKVKAKNVVLIADSCYSGSLLRGGPSLLTQDGDYVAKLARAAAKRSRQVISSGGLEPVSDGGAEGHSLFAYYFIKALKENNREVVDLENLFHTRVWTPVTEIGDQRPNVGRLKTPMDDDGQFILFNTTLADEKKRRETESERKRQGDEKDALAEIRAERQRLEIERQKLEMEKQLLAQKQQLEREKIELERQKQQLERQQMAALSSSPAKPGADGAGLQSVTFFPVRKKGQNISMWPNASIFEKALVEGITEGVREYSRCKIHYVFDKKYREVFRDASLVEESDYRQALSDLWARESLFATSKRPRKEIVLDVGKKLQSDVSLLLNMRFGRQDWTAYIYAFDTRSGNEAMRQVTKGFDAYTGNTLGEWARQATKETLHEIR